MSAELLMMNPRQVRAVPPAPARVYTGPGAGVYTRGVPYGGIYGGTFPARIRIPTGYSNAVPSKLLLALPGSSGRGTDGTSQMSDTMMAQLDGFGLDAIVIYGQYQAAGSNGGRESAWPYIPAVIAQVQSEWNVDANRITGIGWSAGAFVLWEVLVQVPTLFAGLLLAEAYLNAAAVAGAGATVSPATPTEAARQVALAAPLTAIRQHENLDDGIVSPALATTARDGYLAAGHSNYDYVPHASGGHDPGSMLAGGGATYITNWLLLQSR